VYSINSLGTMQSDGYGSTSLDSIMVIGSRLDTARYPQPKIDVTERVSAVFEIALRTGRAFSPCCPDAVSRAISALAATRACPIMALSTFRPGDEHAGTYVKVLTLLSLCELRACAGPGRVSNLDVAAAMAIVFVPGLARP